MHLEILVEDSSGTRLVDALVPRIIGDYGAPHTWRTHPYKGIGRLPNGLSPKTDPSKRVLLDNLPRLIQGYGRTPGIDVVLVVADTDRRDCRMFLSELNNMLEGCNPRPNVMFRLAIEEIEAWLLGDQAAIRAAYPNVKQEVLRRYVQDSVCETWETLADAVHLGGSNAIKKLGFPASGTAKHEWVEKIAPYMDIDINTSPSFRKFVEGLRRLSEIN